jgi:mannose-6-phosphate isomerase
MQVGNEMNGISLHSPIFFERNRVFRVYRGGKLFHDFFGDDAVDGNHPEEWIASSVKAMNSGSTDPLEGLSIVRGTNVSLAKLMRDSPQEMTEGKPFDVLVKVLDSAVRLPAQAHPDKAFSRNHFNSEHGKTEMWLVLATRPGASIYFGFKEGTTKMELDQAVEDSEHYRAALTDLLQEYPVAAGDVWLIPARAAHAIGAGCLILEVQEPTDFTIQPERWCDQYRLSDQDMYLGLKPKTAMEVFDLSLAGSKAAERWKKTPSMIESASGYSKEGLITYADTPCFAVNRHTLQVGSRCSIMGPAVFVVTQGEGSLHPRAGEHPCRKGDYFFLPHAAGRMTVSANSKLQLVECLPPR